MNQQRPLPCPHWIPFFFPLLGIRVLVLPRPLSQATLARYKHNAFLEDLKKLYELTGVKNQKMTFLFSDSWNRKNYGAAGGGYSVAVGECPEMGCNCNSKFWSLISEWSKTTKKLRPKRWVALFPPFQAVFCEELSRLLQIYQYNIWFPIICFAVSNLWDFILCHIRFSGIQNLSSKPFANMQQSSVAWFREEDVSKSKQHCSILDESILVDENVYLMFILIQGRGCFEVQTALQHSWWIYTCRWKCLFDVYLSWCLRRNQKLLWLSKSPTFPPNGSSTPKITLQTDLLHFEDTEIVEESFLEDVANMLSSGEVPNLFTGDELSTIRASLEKAGKESGRAEELFKRRVGWDEADVLGEIHCRFWNNHWKGHRFERLWELPLVSQEAKIAQTPEAMYDFFISRVRENLHIALRSVCETRPLLRVAPLHNPRSSVCLTSATTSETIVVLWLEGRCKTAKNVSLNKQGSFNHIQSKSKVFPTSSTPSTLIIHMKPYEHRCWMKNLVEAALKNCPRRCHEKKRCIYYFIKGNVKNIVKNNSNAQWRVSLCEVCTPRWSAAPLRFGFCPGLRKPWRRWPWNSSRKAGMGNSLVPKSWPPWPFWMSCVG